MRTRTKIPMFRIGIELVKDFNVPNFYVIYLKKGNSEKMMVFPFGEEEKIIKLFEEELKSFTT